MLGTDLSIALIVGYMAAVVFFFTRALKGGPRGILFVVLGTAVLGGAPVTRDGAEAVRCLVALTLVILLLHMWDLHLDPCRERRLSLRGYMIFLVDYAWSAARVTDGYGVGLPWKRRGLDAAKYVGGFCLASVIVVGAFRVDWRRYPSWLEHSVKSTCLGAWTIWAFPMKKRVVIRLLCETDHQALLEARRELLRQVASGTLKSGVYAAPETSRFAEPMPALPPRS